MAAAIIWLVNTIISLAVWFIIGSAILSWLVAFDIVNLRNRFVASVAYFLDRVTAPMLEPFRRVIPPLGGIDLTPIIVIIVLQFLRVLFNNTAAPALYGLLGG
ncbi:YggT family protein [Brevundimonas sp. 2R-24]|uniref:YggT family protein n=1 Tax=Peiella sedimenti TaxID=3061083 RepID=A0ABT8SK53_9CAUL|nr:YggT family protein [Caulobacteraceae bacterium XZ-24]